MLRGKRALVVGVANSRSIAWGVADRWRQEGAEVVVTYQNERFRKPVEKLVRERWGPFDDDTLLPAAACDVSNEREIAALWRTLQERGFCSASDAPATFKQINNVERHKPGGAPSQAEVGAVMASSGSERGGREQEDGSLEPIPGVPKKVDFMLHSVAHAPSGAMRQGSFLMGTTKDDFVSAHVVSAYSLLSTTRHALPFLAPGASVVALTYAGSQRATKNYNVMGPAKASLESCVRALAQELGGLPAQGAPGGIRVNCLSPGPVRTMAARGIAGFDGMRREAAERAPLMRDVGLEEIAGVATFLVSPLASAVTGQTVYADCGLSAVA